MKNNWPAKGWIRPSRSLRFTLLLTAMAFALGVMLASTESVMATVIAYYPFDSATTNVTPDSSGLGNNADLVNGATGATATISATTPMFGTGSLLTTPKTSTSTSGNSAVARVLDGDTDFDRTYDAFSLSLWIKPTTNGVGQTGWTENLTAGTAGASARLIAGKSAGNGQRGWQLSKNPNAGNNQLSFAGFESTGTSSPSSSGPSWSVTHTFTTPQSDTGFMHVAVVFDDSDGPTSFLGLYINGILSSSIPVTSPNAGTTVIGGAPIAQINGVNNNAFQIANRGDSTGGTSAGYIGFIDDFLLMDNAATNIEVALVHGLGRLAGVHAGAGVTIPGVDGELLAVRDAYLTGVDGSSANAGGQTWYRQSSVGAGPVGTIGGSVAGADAFIVLGSDGSGVALIPEPESLVLTILGVSMALCIHRRYATSENIYP
jgi:hypothetical protein